MKITVSKLRRIVRKVITEHIDDGSHKLKHGKVPAVSEPHLDYVKGMALGFYDEGDYFEDYLAFGEQYGYTEDELELFWDAAVEQLTGSSFDKYGFGDGGRHSRL